jgi:hypothetical protein
MAGVLHSGPEQAETRYKKAALRRKSACVVEDESVTGRIPHDRKSAWTNLPEIEGTGTCRKSTGIEYQL